MRPPVSRETFYSSLCAGFIAALICFLCPDPEHGGTLLVFLAGLPLLFIGLKTGARSAAIACISGSLLTGLAVEPAYALFFTGFIALPCYYLVRRMLYWRGNDAAREWYPAIRTLAELTIIAAAWLTVMALAARDQGGLYAMVPHALPDLRDLDPDITVMMQQFFSHWSFVVFSACGWLWVMLIYALSLMANGLLAARHSALRPSLALGVSGLPGWLLVLLGVSGALAMTAQGDDRYTAEAVFVLLLLPYLLCGFALVHLWSIERGIRLRKLWIACVYIASIRFGWPLLAVIAAGLYCQLTEMLDRHKKIG